MVYEPREDSELLAQAVRAHAHGNVIDVGTGTGIQARTAEQLDAVTSVEAVDIDEQAIALARENGIDAHQSDKFSDVNRASYDTIICNAPYLPDEPLAPDVALDGGPNGYEWTIDFLAQARSYLSREGSILLLFSTLTNEHVIKDWLLEHAMDWEELSREKHSFEELIAYRITWALPQHPEAQYLASGKRSRVYRVGDDAIKKAAPRRVVQEALMLRRANKLGLGPTYKGHGKDWVRMSYVPGPRIEEFIQEAAPQEVEQVLTDVQRQATVLDEAGIDKQEMTNPYKHVIVAGDGPVLIDWERARASKRPQNTTQLREYVRKLRRRYPEKTP